MLKFRCHILKLFDKGGIKMTSYELLDFYEEVLVKIEELNVYTEALTLLINTVNTQKDSLLNVIYTHSVNQADTMKQTDVNKNSIITSMQKFAMDFDILTNHEKLIKVSSEIESILSNSPVELEEEIDRINGLLNNYSDVTNIIMKYLKTRNNDAIVQLINKASVTVSQYDKFVESYSSIKDFIQKTENKIEEKEDEKLLEIHLYDHQLNPKYFIVNLQAIQISYEIMCKILDVSLSEHELKVIKIESGSLVASFFGYKAVVESLSLFMKKIVELIFNKYTLEGEILRDKQLLELLIIDAEVIEKYRELGIDLTDENIYKYHFQLIKSFGKLVAQTTKVKINDQQFNLDLDNHLKQKYLIDSKVVLLEEIAIDSSKNETE